MLCCIAVEGKVIALRDDINDNDDNNKDDDNNDGDNDDKNNNVSVYFYATRHYC